MIESKRSPLTSRPFLFPLPGLLASWLALCLPTMAALTAGWAPPIPATAIRANPQAKKLETPPTESTYFQPGDELWDVSKLLLSDTVSGEEQSAWTGEFLVWNARSNRIVARGAFNEIVGAEQGLCVASQGLNLRARVEFTPEEKDSSAPADSLSLLASTGSKAIIQRDAYSVQLENQASDTSPAIHFLRMDLQWPGNDGAIWNARITADVHDGRRIRIASGGGVQVDLITTRLTLSNTPLTEARTQEKNGQIEAWPLAEDRFAALRSEQLPDGRWLRWYPVKLRKVPAFLEWQESNPPAAVIPPELSGYLHGRLLDAGALLAKWGLHSFKNSIALYDPLAELLILAGDEKLGEAYEDLTTPAYGLPENPIWLELRGPGDFAAGVISRHGELSTITRKSGKEETFTFQSSIYRKPENGRFDLACEWQEAGQQNKAETTLDSGTPVELKGRNSSALGSGLKARIETVEALARPPYNPGKMPR